MRKYRALGAKVGSRIATRGKIGLGACAVAGILAALPARGETVSIPSLQSRTTPSSFVLDFGQLGGVSSANITQSYIRLDVDPRTQSARFSSYVQFVQPLILPDGSSTGNILVVIERPSEGVFDRSTGAFRIPDDEYSVYFDGDLSAYGITSPFRLPSPSEGVVEFSTVSTGETRMEWRGEAALPSPFQPGQYIPFSYTCSVNGSFTLRSSATWIMRSEPGQNLIDGRQPYPANDAGNWQGWSYIDLTFNAPLPTALQKQSLVVTETGGDGVPPEVRDVEMLNDRTARAWFSEPVEPGAWTQLQAPSLDLGETGVCVAALPGDVTNDGVTDLKDYLRLFHYVRGYGAPLELNACDINRNGSCNVDDLRIHLNLLNGSNGFDRWLGVRVGPSPCGR